MSEENNEVAANAAKEAEGLWTRYVRNAKSPVSTVQENFFSKAAWKENTLRTGIKAGGTLFGVAIAADAVLRSEKSGDDGRPESRSALGRLVQAVLGLGIAAGSALHTVR